MTRIFLAGVLVAVLSTAEGGSKCPSRTEMHPCVCHQIIQNAQPFTLVTCSKLEHDSDFLAIPRVLDRMMIDRLVLENYNFTRNHPLTLPEEWLGNVRFRELEIFDVKLSENIGHHLCFKGQETTLVKISIRNSIIPPERNWRGHRVRDPNLHVLSVTKNLQEIDLSWNEISSVMSVLFSYQLDVLHTVDLSHNIISSIDPKAFQKCPKLNKINLSHNMITTIPSFMFDSQMSVMDFSYNMITSVPADMFSNATLNSSSQVLFKHNKLQDLPMDRWMSAIQIANKVDVSDNFFTCDCSLAWIGQTNTEDHLIGSCSNPGEMELVALRNFTLKENCTTQ